MMNQKYTIESTVEVGDFLTADVNYLEILPKITFKNEVIKKIVYEKIFDNYLENCKLCHALKLISEHNVIDNVEEFVRERKDQIIDIFHRILVYANQEGSTPKAIETLTMLEPWLRKIGENQEADKCKETLKLLS